MADVPQASVIDGYANALLEVAKAEGARDLVADELFTIARAFEGSDELRATLTDARVPVERKHSVVSDLLDTRASNVSIALINLLVGAGRTGDLVAVANRMAELVAESEALTVAEVRSAIALDDATVARLEAKLAETTGKRVTAKVVVDPTMVGGIVTKIGDTILDGSVKSRLQDLREVWG